MEQEPFPLHKDAQGTVEADAKAKEGASADEDARTQAKSMELNRVDREACSLEDELALQEHRSRINTPQVLSDGEIVSKDGDGNTRIHTRNEDGSYTHSTPPLEGHDGAVHALHVLPDGTQVLPNGMIVSGVEGEKRSSFTDKRKNKR